jgi:hypothetical protein
MEANPLKAASIQSRIAPSTPFGDVQPQESKPGDSFTPSQSQAPMGQASLVFFTPPGRKEEYELAWKVQIPLEKPLGDWRIYVSAATGRVIAHENDIWIDRKG